MSIDEPAGTERGQGGDEPTYEDERRRTRAVQAQRILKSIDDVDDWPTGSGPTGDAEFFHRKRSLLVRDWHRDTVAGILRRAKITARIEDMPGSLTRLWLDRDVPSPAIVRWMETGRPDPDLGLPELIDPVPANFVSPEHLFYVCSVYPCAATEPEVVPSGASPDPDVQTGAGGQGEGVRVMILDTGLVDGATTDHSWLAGVTGDRDDPLGPPDANGVQLLEQDGGHGTFTAGCLRAAAPKAQLHVVDATTWLIRKEDAVGTIGATYEGDLARIVRDVLTDPAGGLAVPDVLLVNFAGPTQDDRPPPGLVALYDDLLQHLRELVIVAPAGNEGDTTRNWPAAFPWVVGVGSLAPDRKARATFSNRGPTVDVWAPGADIVNAFARGEYEYVWPGPVQGRVTFEGMARWSGTSFAGPLVAGLIAARTSTTGQTSRRAWLSLLDLAESQAVPGTGPVLYPGQGSGA
jgi:hypothetical protein